MERQKQNKPGMISAPSDAVAFGGALLLGAALWAAIVGVIWWVVEWWN